MSIKKRMLSMALTATMLATLPTAAFAADSNKLELVVSGQTNNITGNLGENKYFWDDENGDRLLISITEDDIADFAESGEFSYAEITNLNELFECADDEYVLYWTDNSFKNGYAQLGKFNDDGMTSCYCVYCDGSELSVIGEYGSFNFSISANGYTARRLLVPKDLNGSFSDQLHISIIAPEDGKSSYSRINLGDSWSAYVFPNTCENAYVLSADGEEEENKKLTLYIISETGEIKEVDDLLGRSIVGLPSGILQANDEFIMFDVHDGRIISYIYLVDENELIGLNRSGLEIDGETVYADSIKDSSSEIFNNKLIIQLGRYNADDVYALYDLEENKIISEGYSYLGTNDGIIYLAGKADGTWGYLDSNGNEIQFFEDASDFIGDYAPVIKDGKAYLIDRNMNIVSDGVEADGVSTIGENLYTIRKGEERYLTTFKLNDSAATDEPVTDEPIADEPVADEPIADEPVADEPVADEPIADEPIADEPIADEPIADEPVADEPAADTPVVDTDAAVDTGKDNPDTGAEGIAAIAAIGITAIGAALLSKKKK